MGTNPILRLWEQNSLLDFMELNLENLKKHTLTHTHTDTQTSKGIGFFDSLVRRYGIDKNMYSPPNGKKS